MVLQDIKKIYEKNTADCHVHKNDIISLCIVWPGGSLERRVNGLSVESGDLYRSEETLNLT